LRAPLATVAASRASRPIAPGIGPDAGNVAGILTVHSPGIPGETVRMIADHLPTDSMLRSDGGRRLIAKIPRDRLLTETEGPFTQVADRPARPPDVRHTVAQLATFLDLSPEILAEQIQLNLLNLVSA
jgi:hypothetical protein